MHTHTHTHTHEKNTFSFKHIPTYALLNATIKREMERESVRERASVCYNRNYNEQTHEGNKRMKKRYGGKVQ